MISGLTLRMNGPGLSSGLSSVLSRYVMRNVLGYTVLVLAVLLILIGLYLFLDQTDELGVGRYGVFDALVVVACRLPLQAFTLLPIAALMGALLALGNLARGSELVAMRAAGVSVFALAGWVMMAGVLLTTLTWALGDYVSPPAERFADHYKALTTSNQYAASGSETVWAKDGNMFVSVTKQTDAAEFGGVQVMRFDDNGRLQSVARAHSADLDQSDQWTLHDYAETRFEAGRTVVTRQTSAALRTGLSAEFLGAANADPDLMTGRALLRYVQYLQANKLENAEYRTAFWTRIARTCTLMVIVVLAVPFSFGPMRSSGMGARMVIGILIGAVFFLLAKLLENAREVYDLHPLLVAWGPTGILALITSVALARVR